MMLPASNRSQTEPSIARIEAFVECQTTKNRPNYDQVGTVNSRNCVEAESRLTRFAVNTSPSPAGTHCEQCNGMTDSRDTDGPRAA
jgi:hypothetical protein